MKNQVDLEELEVWNTADLILGHDINPDNYHAVEQFLLRSCRRRVSKRFIEQCQQAARRQRDQDRTNGLFEQLFRNVDYTGKTSDDFKQVIAEDVAVELDRLAAANNIAEPLTNAAYLTALLLIECVAWRRNDECNAAAEQQALADLAAEEPR
jgi:hypothetical protein